MGEPSTAAIQLAADHPGIFWDWLSFGESVADHREEQAREEQAKQARKRR